MDKSDAWGQLEQAMNSINPEITPRNTRKTILNTPIHEIKLFKNSFLKTMNLTFLILFSLFMNSTFHE